MTTAEIVKTLSVKFELSQAEAKKLLSSVLSVFKENLVNHRRFTIPDLGTFDVSERKERKSYNPHHKKVLLFPKKIVAAFRQSKSLQDQVK